MEITGKKRIIFTFGIISIVLLTVLFFLLILTPISGEGSIPTSNQQIIKNGFTSNSKTVCSGGSCQVYVYSTDVFTQESDGNYYPLSQVSSIKWENSINAFNFSYHDYWVALEPFVIYNGQYKTIQDIKTAFPMINFRNYTSVRELDHKFSLNITGVPQNIVNNIDFLGFKVVGVNGLTLNDVRKEGTSLIIKDKVSINFQDLIDSGYTLNIVNQTYLLIGNIQAKYSNGNIYLDPLVQLTNGNNQGDTYVDVTNPASNYGTGTTASLGWLSTTRMMHDYFKFNITGLSASNLTKAELYIYISTNGLDASTENYTITSHRVYPFPTYNITNAEWAETTITYNNMPNSTEGQYNITPDDSFVIIGGAGEPTGYQKWDVTDTLRQEFDAGTKNVSILLNATSYRGSPATNDQLTIVTKEGTTITQRPYLLLTYNTSSCLSGWCDFNGGTALEDVYVTDGGNTAMITFIKWLFTDLTSISSVSVDNATLCMYLYAKTGSLELSPDSDVNITYINNQTWNEATPASGFSSLGKTNQTNTTMNSTTAGTISCFNVTQQVRMGYQDNLSNFSIGFFDSDTTAGYNTVSDTDYLSIGAPAVTSFKYRAREYVLLNESYHLYVGYTIVTPNTAPKWQTNSTNSTTAGTQILHSINWTDDTALSGYIFSFDNGTGTFVNDSFVSMIGTINWSNVTKGVNTNGGVTIQWKIYANDSANAWNVTSTFSYLTIDTTFPTYSNIGVNNTSPAILDQVLFSTLWADNTALSSYIFSWNATGLNCDTWANDSIVTFNGIQNWSNVTKQIPSTCLLENIPSIGWKIYVNDSSNNWNATPITNSFVSTYSLNITQPNTTSPLTVSSGQNITVYYNFTKSGSPITSNVDIKNITIGGNICSIDNYGQSQNIVDNNGSITTLSPIGDGVVSLGATIDNATWLSFDGSNDNVSLGNYSSINTTNIFTVSVWFKADNLTTTTRKSILSKGKAGSYEWELRSDATPKLSSAVFDTLGNNYWSCTSTTTLVTGQWYHAVMEVNGSASEKLYINGKLECTDITTSGTRETDNLATIYVGSRETLGVNLLWNGSIDDIRIYNYSLNALQILRLYNESVYSSAYTGLGIPVLSYHQVKEPDDDTVIVTTANFSNQMAWLFNNGYRTITYDNYYQWKMNNNFTMPKKPVIIIFDDGRLNVFTNATPIMDSYGFVGVIAIVTNYVISGDPLFMNWTQIQNLSSKGWQVASHSVSHCDMIASCNSSANWTDQFTNSKTNIDGNISGQNTSLFVYPFNSNNDSSDSVCGGTYKMCSGWSSGTATNNAFLYKEANLTHTDGSPAGLRRIIIANSSTVDDLSSAIDYYNNLAGRWKFNENTGTTVYDISGNANNGTINNATWQDDGINLNLSRNIDYSLNGANFTIINQELSWTNILAGWNYQTYNPTTKLWNVNCTAPSGTGLQDLQLWANYTTDNILRNSTALSSISYSACSLDFTLSSNLSSGILFNVDSLPSTNLSASGNNGTGISQFNVSITATGCTANLSTKANSALTIIGTSNTIPLANEKYSYNKTDNTVPADIKTSLTTSYATVDTALTSSTVYFKYFLNVSSGQSAGTYNNTVSFQITQT